MSSGGIGIMGTPVSSGNRGVLALTVSLIDLIRRIRPESQVRLLIGYGGTDPFRVNAGADPVEIPIHRFRLSPRCAWNEHLSWLTVAALLYRGVSFGPLRRWLLKNTPWLRFVHEADFVADIRGGDSFSDIYGLRRMVLGSLPAMIVLWVRGEILLLPQTYGPYRHPVSRWIARWIVGRASVVMARDDLSAEAVGRLVGGGMTAVVCPDVAFGLPAASTPFSRRMRRSRKASAATLVGLNVNGLMFRGGYTRRNMFGLALDYKRFLSDLVEWLAGQAGIRILLVPHTYASPGDVESDVEAGSELLTLVSPRSRRAVEFIREEYDCQELKGIVGGCEFFVGSRMHACIAALSQGIPCVGVAYSQKFAGIFASVEMMDHVVDARETTHVEAEQQIQELWKKRAETGRRLPKLAAGARQNLERVFGSVFGRSTRPAGR